MDVVKSVKMEALCQVLLYFGYCNYEIWNFYFCNSYLFRLKPLNRKCVRKVFPSLLNSYFIKIQKEYCETIIVL